MEETATTKNQQMFLGNAANMATKHFCFWNRTRFFVLGAATFCISLIMSNQSMFYLTILCMRAEERWYVWPGQNSTISNEIGKNAWAHTKHLANFTYKLIVTRKNFFGAMYSKTEQGWLFAAIAIGTIFGTLPFGHLVHRYGFRKIFFLYGNISAVSTMLLPLFAKLGLYPLLILLFIQGTTFCITVVSMDALSSAWSGMHESGLFLSIISSNSQLARAISPPIAALFCESSLGWNWVYYSFGSLSLISQALFVWFYTDQPSKHRYVGEKELKNIAQRKNEEKVQKRKQQQRKEATILQETSTNSNNEELEARKTSCSNKDNEKGKRSKIPYKEILTDSAVWSIYFAVFAGTWGNQVFVQYGPEYLHRALKIGILRTGIFSASPYLLAIAIKIPLCMLTDRLTFMTDKMRVIFYAYISEYLMAAFYVCLVFLPVSEQFLIQCCYNGVVIFAGLYNIGAVKNSQMIAIAGKFSSTVTASTMFLIAIVRISVPLFVTLMAHDNTIEQWSRIFAVTAITLVFCAFVAQLTAKYAPREWAINAADQKKNDSY